MPTLRAVIFDLGNVLIDVRSAETPRQWAEACGADAVELERLFFRDTAHRRLERGESSLREYHQHMVEQVGRPIEYEQFVHGWCNVFGDVLPGVERMLDSLDDSLRLVCLSNTNAAHTELWRVRYAGLLKRFERVFVSHEMGARKPESACYRQVLDYLALPAATIAFVDDKPANVDAAKAQGLHGIVAKHAEQITRELARLGAMRGEEDYDGRGHHFRPSRR